MRSHGTTPDACATFRTGRRGKHAAPVCRRVSRSRLSSARGPESDRLPLVGARRALRGPRRSPEHPDAADPARQDSDIPWITEVNWTESYHAETETTQLYLGGVRSRPAPALPSPLDAQ